MPSLRSDFTRFYSQMDGLLDLCANVAPLEAKYRKAVAEIALIRGFDLLQGIFLIAVAKLTCGASYLDNTTANVLLPARSQATALSNMSTHGRVKPKHRTQWSKVSEIKDNCSFVIDTSEHFFTTLTYHSGLIDDMRNVRNRIAHNNRNSRQKYQLVV